MDISSFGNSNDISSKYEELFNHILEKIPDDRPFWPNSKDYADAGSSPRDKDVEKMLKTLKNVRKEYPGWLIAPKESRDILKSIRNSAEITLHTLRKQRDEKELEFLFEYDWIREKCLRPPFTCEIETYATVIDRNIDNIDLTTEHKKIIVSILISLMRDCRESGNFQKWKEHHKKTEILIALITN